jgi:predicted protein tyrosine phosphatase
MERLRVLCICAVGVNRSKYLAQYLRGKGYSTRYGGVDYKWNEGANPIDQKDVNWAEVIIITRKRLKPALRKKFKIKNKKIIVLDVTDSKRLIPEKFAHLRELDHHEFQKKWTRPKLREAIKPYLPLKK